MKTKIAVFTLAVLLLASGGWRLSSYFRSEDSVEVRAPIPVTVADVAEKDIEEALIYDGVIRPEATEKISFKTSGRLAYFPCEVGEVIEGGVLLASLDTTDLELALEGAEKSYEAAVANYNNARNGATQQTLDMAEISVQKAEESLSYLEQKLPDMEVMYEDGVISRSEYDSFILELDMARKDLELAGKSLEQAEAGTDTEIIEAAEAQMDLAAVNVKVQEEMLDDASYITKESVILIKRNYENGELVPAGYPVAILRSRQLQVRVGVSGKDIPKIHVGQEVTVTSRNNSSVGSVSRIAEIPDESNFLYEVSVTVENRDFTIGEIAQCRFITGSKSAVTVPVTALMNDGIDYVYVVEDDIAMLKQIEIEEILDGEVVVEGLEVGDLIITGNVERIQDQSPVVIEE